MGLTISGRFNPLRMVLTRREPVQFSLILKNNDAEEKKLTVKVILSPELAFTKGGFKNSELVRIDALAPGKEKTLYFNLHPKISTNETEQKVSVRVQEHAQNFQFAKSQFDSDFFLPVQR